MRRLKFLPFLRNNRAISYAVSAIIITGTTLTLVLIASVFAYQTMERQRGFAEFETVQKSMLTFNDGLENSAWKVGAARATRFTIQYGYLQLVPNAGEVSINATLGNQSLSLLSDAFSVIKYYLSNNYVSFDPSYQTYILGNSASVVYGSSDSYGRAVIMRPADSSDLAAVILDYRVRILGASVLNVNGTDVNYIDIRVIKLSMSVTNPWSYIHDFDLKTKCIGVKTTIFGNYTTSGGETLIAARLGQGNPIEQVSVSLVPGEVVFNVAVAEMQVNV